MFGVSAVSCKHKFLDTFYDYAACRGDCLSFLPLNVGRCLCVHQTSATSYSVTGFITINVFKQLRDTNQISAYSENNSSFFLSAEWGLLSLTYPYTKTNGEWQFEHFTTENKNH